MFRQDPTDRNSPQNLSQNSRPNQPHISKVKVKKDNGDGSFDIMWLEDEAEDTAQLEDLKLSTQLGSFEFGGRFDKGQPIHLGHNKNDGSSEFRLDFH